MDKSDLPELREIAAKLTTVNKLLDLEGASSTSEFPEVQRLMDEADDLFSIDRLESYRLSVKAAELWLEKLRGKVT